MAILKASVADLSACLGQTRLSSIWLSEPRYVIDQPDYFNLVVSGDCDLSPESLLDRTSDIEAKYGRDRTKERPKGPRRLDIDLLLYGESIIDSERLTLPHPGMEERKFVLLPLVELSRDLKNPRTGKPYIESLAALGRQGIYLVPSSDYYRSFLRSAS